MPPRGIGARTVERLRAHAESGQISDGLIPEGRRQELDQLAAATLGPSPCPTLVKSWQRIEFER